MMAKIRTVLWTLVVVAALGAGWIFYTDWTQSRSGPDYAAAQYGAGDYELVTAQGAPVDDSVFVGKPSLVFFGFTHCPDVCPTTLGDMQYWFDQLGGQADAINAYFVSVDPERDTPQVLGDYVGWVSDRITGITGEPEEIDKIVDAWGVLAERVPLDDGGYTMNHTASVFLIDSQGKFFGTIAYQEDPQTALGKIERLIAEG